MSRTLVGKSYTSAEMQSVYSIAPSDWATHRYMKQVRFIVGDTHSNRSISILHIGTPHAPNYEFSQVKQLLPGDMAPRDQAIAN